MKKSGGRNHSCREPTSKMAFFVLFLGTFAILCLLYASGYDQKSRDCFLFSQGSLAEKLLSHGCYSSSSKKDGELDALLKRVAIENNTLILTMINKPYAESNSMFDLFLQSFQAGEGTQQLIKHLLVVAVDQPSFEFCRQLHLHCYRLDTEGEDFSDEQFYRSKSFVKMMWRRLLFVADVLGRGYNILLTDSDILWLRNPFPRFSLDDDMQVSCDRYRGEPYDRMTEISAGFYFVRSNSKTIKLYELWYESRDIGIHEQDVLQKLQKRRAFQELGLRFRFMETLHFSGFCQKSADLGEVNTMHANCCKSKKAKLADLRSHFEAWKKFMATEYSTSSRGTWPNSTICRGY